MEQIFITDQSIDGFRMFLKMEERARGTVEKYVRDVEKFRDWLDGRGITKDLVGEWKEELVRLQYCPTTINSMLASLHGFFKYAGIEGCNVKFLKIQRRMFREQERELNKEEYRPAWAGRHCSEGENHDDFNTITAVEETFKVCKGTKDSIRGNFHYQKRDKYVQKADLG